MNQSTFFLNFKIYAPPIWGRRAFVISFGPCWNHPKASSVNICVSELFNCLYIQFVFVGCWVSSSGPHSYLFPTQKVPLAQKELFGVFFVANRIVDYIYNCTLFSFSVFLCSWVLWPLCRRQTIILASLPLYPYPFHNFSTFSFIILSTCLCYYFLHILASLTPLLTFL